MHVPQAKTPRDSFVVVVPLSTNDERCGIQSIIFTVIHFRSYNSYFVILRIAKGEEKEGKEYSHDVRNLITITRLWLRIAITCLIGARVFFLGNILSKQL